MFLYKFKTSSSKKSLSSGNACINFLSCFSIHFSHGIKKSVNNQLVQGLQLKYIFPLFFHIIFSFQSSNTFIFLFCLNLNLKADFAQ